MELFHLVIIDMFLFFQVLEHFDNVFDTDTIKHIKLNMPLIKNIFRSLEEEFRRPSPKYDKLRSKQIKITDKLYPTLNEEQKKLYEKCCQINNELAGLEDEQLICFGYILGKQLDEEGKMSRN